MEPQACSHRLLLMCTECREWHVMEPLTCSEGLLMLLIVSIVEGWGWWMEWKAGWVGRGDMAKVTCAQVASVEGSHLRDNALSILVALYSMVAQNALMQLDRRHGVALDGWWSDIDLLGHIIQMHR